MQELIDLFPRLLLCQCKRSVLPRYTTHQTIELRGSHMQAFGRKEHIGGTTRYMHLWIGMPQWQNRLSIEMVGVVVARRDQTHHVETSRTTTRASNDLSPTKSACSGDAVLRTSTRGTVHMGQCAPEDSISQCPFLQMIDTAGNPHADGSAAPGARPRHRPSRHRDPPATSRAHDNWMAARQTSCRQQTAPPPPRCSKDVTAHPHRPGARPGRPCQVPARSGQPLSGRSGFSPAFGTEFF